KSWSRSLRPAVCAEPPGASVGARVDVTRNDTRHELLRRDSYPDTRGENSRISQHCAVREELRSSLLRDTINPGVSGIHPHGSSVLLHESDYLAHNPVSAPSPRGRHDTELSAAKRLEHDRIIEVRPVRRNDGQFLFGQYDLPIPPKARIKPAEALPRWIPGERWRLGHA